ncbi:hypothetical protein Q5424_02835 [Conexibacter sp. JD483]|uniref:hypothetical protein n=1 Tax=unclassified Conexibacter TaxID=2627773 RepID=UPI00271FDCB2|nr:MULTISPECIES: hypothetical protein [unclassified Conexibacter]MDO8185041.1 hypothetical protein [Conexibacter sp. CPCC 205706]MDO8196751.1 hypothetical protein [Conexibacter sp. CPCC 205762]MDR9367999.1 hypothetical protein [Conexibacter sp. JD483]
MPVRRSAALRALLLALAVSAPAAATAAAAWRELPPYEVPGDASAACLRASGPGGLSLLGGMRRTELLTVDAAGISVAGTTGSRGRIDVCTEAATLPQPPLTATGIRVPHSGRFARQRLAVTDGAGRRTVLTRRPVWVMTPPAVAGTASGAAVVAWLETRSARRPTALMAATRPSANAPFGVPQQLGSSQISYTAVRAGIDDSGRAHVAWLDGGSGRSTVTVASAAPGARFAPARALGSVRDFSAGKDLALAVAGDGRALIAGPRGERLGLWELAAGGARFAPAGALQAPADQIALALRPDGAAVVASRSAEPEAISLARRQAGGAFGAVEALLTPQGAPPRRMDGDRVTFVGGGTGGELLGSRLSAALSAGGEIVVTSFASAEGGAQARVAAWRGTLAGAGSGRIVRDGRFQIRIAGRARSLGSSCRSATGVVALQLADGRLAVAWSDDGSSHDLLGLDVGDGDGQLHVAIPSEAAPATAPPAAPRLRAQVLGDGVVGSGTPLRVRVSCGTEPCDVRASADVVPFSARSRSAAVVAPVVSASTPLAAGQRGELRLAPTDSVAFARPGRRVRPKISLLACTPDGAAQTRLTLRPRLRGRALSPQPRIVGLRAVRRGDRIVVRWRLSRPAPRGSSFTVLGYDGERWPVAFPRGEVRRAGDTWSAVLRVEQTGRPGQDTNGPIDVAITLATAETPDAAEAQITVR